MLYIPTIPLIRSVNERLSIYLLPRDVVVIDILNQKGKRVYLRVSWKILKSIRQRKVYKSLVEGAKLNIEEEGEVAMVHRWNITFGKASNYGYQVLFNSNLQSCGIGSDKYVLFLPLLKLKQKYLVLSNIILQEYLFQLI